MKYFLIILTAVFGLAAAPVPKTGPLPPATEKMWQDSADNLKDIGMALHAYHDTYGHFPQNITDAKGKPLLSWRVHLLPFMNGESTYREFKFDEPWNSDHNLKLTEKMPKTFQPVRVKPQPGLTYYLGFQGEDTLFRTGKVVGIANIVDGCSNTAMLVEADLPVEWTKPFDLQFDAKKELPKLGGLFDGSFNMLMADGSARRVKKGFNADLMKFVVQISDGQAVDMDRFGK